MKLIQLLLEYNREKTLSSWSQKIELASNQDQNKSAEEVLSYIEEVDPSINKQFVVWIVKQYVKRTIQIDDLSIVKLPLVIFQKYKNRLPSEKRDINKLTISDLFNIHDEIMNPNINYNEDDAKEETIEQFGTDVKVWYNGPLGTLITPLTKDASCKFGKGTKWCTAAEIAANKFGVYNDVGNLYIWRDKSGEKYQIFLQNDNIFNDQNTQVSDEVKSKLLYNPILKQLLSKDGKLYKLEEKQFLQKVMDKQDDINDALLKATKIFPANDGDNIFAYAEYCGIVKIVKNHMSTILKENMKDLILALFETSKATFNDSIQINNINSKNTILISMLESQRNIKQLEEQCITGMIQYIVVHSKEMNNYIRFQLGRHNTSKQINFVLIDSFIGKNNEHVNFLRNNGIRITNQTFSKILSSIPNLSLHPSLKTYLTSIGEFA